MCLLGGVEGVAPSIFLKLHEIRSKVGHAAIEKAKVYSVTFSISNSVLLLLVVGQTFKHHLSIPNVRSLGTSLLGGSWQVLGW